MDVPKQLETLLSCSLCGLIYDLSDAKRLPKELDCRHIYCAGCLDQLPGFQKVSCPQCKQETPLPILSELPTNEVLMFLLQQMPALNLGMFMSRLQREQQLQPTGSSLTNSAWPNWLNEVGLDRQLRGANEHCNLHAMPNTSWCHTCQRLLCRDCVVGSEHRNHELTRQLNMCHKLRQLLYLDLKKIEERITYAEVLASDDISMLRQLSDACDTVKQQLQRQIVQHAPTLCTRHMRDWWLRARMQSQLHGTIPGNVTRYELLRLLHELKLNKFQKQMVHIYRECRLRASIQEGGLQLLDFEQLHRRLMSLRQPPFELMPATVEPPPELLLTNYCVYAIWWNMQQKLLPAELEEEGEENSAAAASAPARPVGLLRHPLALGYPIYYLDLEMEGKPAGRVLIEVRNDVAPRMAENFRALILHLRGFGYSGCSVFHAWGDEIIITGDFEFQNGNGGYAALEGGFFMPDDTGLPARRGAVGMRRGQKPDHSGLVDSQFYMVRDEKPCLTAIFGFIVDGIDVLDKIANTGKATGWSAMCTYIKNCGEYNRSNF